MNDKCTVLSNSKDSGNSNRNDDNIEKCSSSNSVSSYSFVTQVICLALQLWWVQMQEADLVKLGNTQSMHDKCIHNKDAVNPTSDNE